MDTFSIRGRLAELMDEIEQLSKEDLKYKKIRRYARAEDIFAHDQRMVRMKYLLEEIAMLMKKPV